MRIGIQQTRNLSFINDGNKLEAERNDKLNMPDSFETPLLCMSFSSLKNIHLSASSILLCYMYCIDTVQ